MTFEHRGIGRPSHTFKPLYKNQLANLKDEDPRDELLESSVEANWKHERGGERRLAQAVIVRALNDAGKAVQTSTMDRRQFKYRREQLREAKKIQKDLVEWFASEERHEFSLHWCAEAVCSTIGNAESLVEKIRADLKERGLCQS